MIERCIMNSKLFKEKLIEQVSKKDIVLTSTVEITDKCNFKCPHCYVEKKSFNNKNMDFDVFLRFISEFKKQGGLYLIFTGGEAILHPEFDRFFITAKKMGFIISVFSNGFIVDSKIELFKKYRPYEIDITLYGVDDKTYLQNTECSNGAKVLRNLDLLKENNITFSLKACVTKQIKPYVNTMRKIARKHNVTFRCDPYVIGNVFDKSSISESRLTSEEIFEEIISDEKLVEYIEENLYKNFDGKNLLYHCAPGKNSVYMDVDGKLTICPFSRRTINYDFTRGNFNEGIQYLRNLGCYKQIETMKCSSCKLSQICKYCPERFLLETGSPYTPPDWMCNVAHMLEKHCNLLKEGNDK